MFLPSSDWQLGRHALELAAVEQVQQQRLQDVVAMVAERDLGGAELARHAVEDAAAQPRAQRAGGLALGHQPLDDAVGVLVLDVERHADPRQVLGQDVLGKARLLLVEVDGDDLEVDRRALAQAQQDVEHRVAVLAARQADHHLVAVLDHVVVADRLADLAREPLEQLVVLVGLLLLAARERAAAEIGDVGLDGLRGLGVCGGMGGVHARSSSLMRKTSTPTASQSG